VWGEWGAVATEIIIMWWSTVFGVFKKQTGSFDSSSMISHVGAATAAATIMRFVPAGRLAIGNTDHFLNLFI